MDIEAQPFWYVAWFRDTTQAPDDQDYEWCACFLIDAQSAELAKQWGDILAHKYSNAMETEVFLWSETQHYDPNDKSVDTSHTPHFAYGHEATDDELGW